ncbi:MAG: NAD(P)/FAD-dependent oxidoreductase [Rhodospirillales bacterium]|nr:NAD(P)/FAD-dependent oxidoreductase [Rhodospirillales bacterium]
MTDTVDTIIAGAGVIGLAIARRLALAGQEVVLLEAENAIGTGISSRNSEVIHAGIHYGEGSMRARLCVPGKEMLYEFCQSHSVSFRRSGKLVVAVEEDELAALDAIEIKAKANGVHDLIRLSADEAKEIEPQVHCAGALLSPSTGIVDSHGLMLALQGDAEAAGAVVALSSPFAGGTLDGNGIIVRVGGAEPTEIRCRHFINAAGLSAQTVAGGLQGLPAEFVPPLYYAKGNYFMLTGKAPFDRPIYPVPGPVGLGVHFTIDLGGQCKFGPDVEWIDKPDYNVNPARAEKFYKAIRRYWPDLPDDALQPGYAGVRPKLAPKGQMPADFTIHGPETHGIDGLVNLFGIDSPGLTSSMAIADHVAGLLGVRA